MVSTTTPTPTSPEVPVSPAESSYSIVSINETASSQFKTLNLKASSVENVTSESWSAVSGGYRQRLVDSNDSSSGDDEFVLVSPRPSLLLQSQASLLGDIHGSSCDPSEEGTIDSTIQSFAALDVASPRTENPPLHPRGLQSRTESSDTILSPGAGFVPHSPPPIFGLISAVSQDSPATTVCPLPQLERFEPPPVPIISPPRRSKASRRNDSYPSPVTTPKATQTKQKQPDPQQLPTPSKDTFRKKTPKPEAGTSEGLPPDESAKAEKRRERRRQRRARARSRRRQQPPPEIQPDEGYDSDSDNPIFATAYGKAAQYITSYLNDPNKQPADRLKFCQALLIEFGVVSITSGVDSPLLPTSIRAAETLLKSRVHINIVDYLQIRNHTRVSGGPQRFDDALFASQAKLIKALREQKKVIPRQWVKERKGLDVLLVQTHS